MHSLDKAYFKLRRKYFASKLKKYIIQKPATIEAFEEVISKYSNDYCFIHGGYSAVNKFFDKSGGMQRLIDVFDKNYKIIFSAAFTLSFKQTGVFHQKYSKPDIGHFAVEFGKYANSRTEDPVASIWIRGESFQHNYKSENSFDPENGIYKYLNNNKTNTICIGTDVVIISFVHYLEQLYKLSYRRPIVYEGYVFKDSDDNEWTKTFYKSTVNYKVLQKEWERLEFDLLKSGVLKRYDFGNLSLRIVNNSDYAEFIKRKTSKDLHYFFYEKS